MKSKTTILAIALFCIIATVAGIYLLGGIDQQQLQLWLQQMGVWAPIIYILVYAIATIFILPSTPLNLSGGAIFGSVWGTVWTSIAAVLAAVLSFGFSRTIGRKFVKQKLAGKWQSLDREMEQGGFFYMFAIRLLPLIPYGMVNFAAGVTSIKFLWYIARYRARNFTVCDDGCGFNCVKTGECLTDSRCAGVNRDVSRYRYLVSPPHELGDLC
jgi:uncharacterized membrane protein YdjX (TVP38/TMEM64 family)